MTLTMKFVCLFGVYRPIFSLVWRRHHCRWRAANFDLCSALRAIEQWGFFNVPHPLRHWPTVYNGHLRGPVTLTPCWAFSGGAVTTWFYDLGLSRPGIEPISRMRGERSTSMPPRHFKKMTSVHGKMWGTLIRPPCSNATNVKSGAGAQISKREIAMTSRKSQEGQKAFGHIYCRPYAALLRHAIRRRGLIFTGNCIYNVT